MSFLVHNKNIFSNSIVMNCTIKFLGKPDGRKKQDKENSEKENTQKISTSSDSESERGNKC